MKQITQKDLDEIINNDNDNNNNNNEFDLSLNIEIESNCRVEDMIEGDAIVISIQLLNGKILKKEYQIIDSQELLLATEEENEIKLRYDEHDEKYYIVQIGVTCMSENLESSL